jgi:hypothetical protein
MNLFLKAVTMVALGCIISQMCGCVSSSNLAGVWHDPSFQAPTLGKMLVIAVRKDATKRRIWEDAFANELTKHGVAATSSYSLFPDALPDTDQVFASVKTNGYDGVLVVLRLPTETNKQYIHGYVTTEQNVRYSYYWNRYRTYYREIEHPGYIDSQKIDIRAIDVTTTGVDGRLIWSATSRTPDPETVPDPQSEIANIVMAELAGRGIIGNVKKE